MKTKTAMILAAGYGKRLKPITNNIPKPLIDINNKSLLGHTIDMLLSCGVENLIKEGVPKNKIKFIGNTMIDSLVMMEKQIDNSKILKDLNLKPNNYCVLTLHRPVNVDNKNQLNEIIENIKKWSGNKTVIWPKHPRIDLDELEVDLSNVIITDPLGYLEFIKLVKNSFCVFTGMC